MHPIEFKELAGTSKLFLDFISCHQPACQYYRYDFRQPASYGQVASEIDRLPYNRKKLVSILKDASAKLKLSDNTNKNIEKLSNPDSLCVFAGQQVGMLLGPMYTVFKALTAYKTAKKLEAELGRPVIPCFWLASDDHDFDEIKTVHFLDRAGDCHAISYEPAMDIGNMPMADVHLDRNTDAFIKAVDEILLPTEFSGEVKSWINKTYRQGDLISDSFAKLFDTVLANFGIVPVDPNSVGMKEIFSPLFAREINNHREIFNIFESQSRNIIGNGYHVQVEKPQSLLNLFITDESGRHNISTIDGIFSYGNREKVGKEELLEMLSSQPQRFSANVILRPIVQCSAFPTVAEIVGPSEAAYFAQIEPLFRYYNVPWPVIRPRLFATLLEPHIKKSYQKLSIDFVRLHNDIEREINRIIINNFPPELEHKAQTIRLQIEKPLIDLVQLVEKSDKESADAIEYTRKRIDHELNHLSKKLLMAHRKRHDTMVTQIRKAAAFMFPLGKYQERVISPLYYINKYGLDVFDEVEASLDVDSIDHQLVEVRK